ncbi:MAG: hypothetical protein ACK5D5_08840 [Bacteroidota bacterium]|jgi:hypothetical protein
MIDSLNNHEDIAFPQFRKYKNDKSYFKILSMETFEEKYFIGKKMMKREFTAVQYPEKLFVRDLLFNYGEIGLKITQEEYESKL